MSFFDAFLNKKVSLDETYKENWDVLNSVEQLTQIKNASKNKIIGIFKHSTRCGISSSVFKRFNQSNLKECGIDFYYLDLLAYREVSNEISTVFRVVHQSPQLLIIKSEDVVFHASHYDILELDLQLISK